MRGGCIRRLVSKAIERFCDDVCLHRSFRVLLSFYLPTVSEVGLGAGTSTKTFEKEKNNWLSLLIRSDFHL